MNTFLDVIKIILIGIGCFFMFIATYITAIILWALGQCLRLFVLLAIGYSILHYIFGVI